MKAIKKIFFVAMTLIATTMASASEVVTLTVNGQGSTKDIAVSNALRSAIEQAFGVFVSANTQIINDELVKDEIATVSSGNIQQYSEMSCVNMPNGEIAVTLQATVAINKLVAYAKSHGSSAEFAGQTFAMNMKIMELNKQNEEKVLQHTYLQLKDLAEHMFDWKLEIGNPRISEDKYTLDMAVTAVSNEASDAFHKTLLNTLRSLSLTPEQVAECKNTNIDIHPILLISGEDLNRVDITFPVSDPKFEYKYILRSPYIYKFLEDVHYLMRAAAISFEIREQGAPMHTYSFAEKKGKSALLGFLKHRFREDEYQKQIEIYEKYNKSCCLLEVAYFHFYHDRIEHKTECELKTQDFDKYTIQVVKKKKMPEPIVYKNNIFRHNISIDIDKDRIGSIAGFEVVHAPKCKVDIEYAPWLIVKDLGDGRYLKYQTPRLDKYCIIDRDCMLIKELPYDINTYSDWAQIYVQACNNDNGEYVILDNKQYDIVKTPVIPEGVTVLDGGPASEVYKYWAFGEEHYTKNGCSTITEITLPSSIVSLKNLRYYFALTTLYCKSITPPSLGEDPFIDTPLKAIFVPRASVEVYKSAPGWKDYAEMITGYDF